jgi:hypothetical protein
VTRKALAPAARPGAAAALFHLGPSSLKPKKRLDPARASEAVPHVATEIASTTSKPLKKLRPRFNMGDDNTPLDV